MWEFFSKVVDKVSDPVILVLLGLLVGSVFLLYKNNQDSRATGDKYVDSVKSLTDKILVRADAHSEELKEILKCYHDDRISMNEALERIRIAISNMGGKL